MGQWREKDEGKGRRAVKLITQIALIAVTALFCVNYLGYQVKMEGRSMEPTVLQDSTLLVNRAAISYFAPSRFDIIVFEGKDGSVQDGESEAQRGRLYTKYVVGLPGETVQIKEGSVWIDGQELNADAYWGTVSLAGLAEDPIVLADDEFFVMGANTGSSEDSRFSTVGNVKRQQIIGTAWFFFHSVTDMGFL